jgi:SOS-response transcriptional repressors (RecA-mediated autopeptidases)
MPSILKLTPVRVRVYEFIVAFKQGHDGIAPSVLEIGKACGISSTSVVRYHLSSLALLGMIECNWGKSRMISVTGARWIPPSQGISLPSPVKGEARVPLVSSLKS